MKSLLLAFFMLPVSQVNGQDNANVSRSNLVYLLPTSIGGDLWYHTKNVWIEYGFTRRLNERHALGFRNGFSMSSKETKTDDLNGIASRHTSGIHFTVEYQYFFREKWFFATDLYGQRTNTQRYEEIQSGMQVNQNVYGVERMVVGVVPKIGFHHDFRYGFFAEAIFGCGLRYISSSTVNKKNSNQNLEKEAFTHKVFDQGDKISQRIVGQLKIGWSF